MNFNKQYSLKDSMNKVIDTIQYDMINIISIDRGNSICQVIESINESNILFNQEAFAYKRIERLIELLAETKSATVLNNKIDQVNNGIYEKINDIFSQEIIIPFFDCNDIIAGFVYLAKIDDSDMNIYSNVNFESLLKILIQDIEKDIYQQKKVENLYDTILLLCEIINAKEPHLIGNIYAVSYAAKAIANQMNLSQSDIQKLQLASLMHDLGKIYIDEKILKKVGRLTDEEYAVMKTRVTHSFNIASKLSQIYSLDDIPEIILHYQERIDGTGYPQGILGENIPQLSKILNVAKAIASMLSKTLYRKAKPLDQIINELKINAGTQFDTEVAEAAIVLLIYRKDQIEDFFSGIGNYATLSISLQDNQTINIWGNVQRKKDFYLFRSMDQIPEYEQNQVTDVNLYLNNNERIIKFKPQIEKKSSNEIRFSTLELKIEEEAFSIEWFLEGSIITRTKNMHEIFINLIGGDFLDFYVFYEKLSEQITDGVVKMNLNDDQNILLPGVIVFQQRINDKVFFRFKYTNVAETQRKKVFSAIFRKQLEIKNMIRGTNYFKALVSAPRKKP